MLIEERGEQSDTPKLSMTLSGKNERSRNGSLQGEISICAKR